MGFYRKKPVVIEARKCQEPEDPHELVSWCGGELVNMAQMGKKMWIDIPTLEGVMRADYGDWIIKGVKGEFYPCKPDIFEQTYEKVSD